MADIINPDRTVMTHNADVYWHYAGDPVQRSQLLGTFTIGTPQKVLLPIPADADIVLRAVPRGGRGQTFMAGPADATPVTISALGVGSGGGTSNFYQGLRVNHGYSSGYAPTPRPILNLLNAFQVKDDAIFGESDLSTFGVPTGLLNLRTDCNASGQIAVTTATVSGTDIVLATTLELQPGQGIFVKGAGVSGSDLVTSCLAVSADGKTITLAAGPFMPGPFTIVQADDTAAVQSWINSKGDLVMPPGYYRLSSSITLPTTSEGFSIVIHGAGWDLSVFAFQNTGDGFVSTSDLKIDSMVFTDLTIGTGTIGDASGTINPANQGIGVRMTAPSYTGIYNNFVMQRCRVLGWGRWGLWSDNLEVSWISQCIFRENKSGHVAFVGPDTISPNKQPNANTITDTTFDQAISAGPSDVKRDFTGSMTAGSRTLTGSGFTSADRGKFVIVLGAATGSPGGDLYTFIDTYNSSTSVTLAHQAQQNSSGTVHLFPVNVASVLLNRANDTVIDGSTIQGNFADAGSGATNVLSDVNAIKVYNSSNCRFIGIHEEDNAGPGGAAIRMENCYSMTIENWGGTSAGPPLFDNAHGADFQLLNSHCVRVSQCFFNDRPQFLMDGNTSEVEIDNSLIVGYINLWQQDASYDRLRIGSGVRVYQAADPRTNQVAGNEYSYDGFFGRNLIVNGRFLDGTGGMEGWTTAAPTWWSLTTTSKTRGGTFLNVDATAIASSTMPTTILHQAVPIPDTTGPGLFTCAFDWNLDSQNGVETTGYYVEVRLHPSSGIDEVSQFSTRRFTVVQDTWQVGHIRCFLGTGTGRTIDVQINVTPGPNNVIMHFANFRLAAGKHIYGAWEQGIHDFGGRMHAPIEFGPISTTGTGSTAPPPVGATYMSMVNDAGTLKIGYNGVWANIGTTSSSSGVAAGTPYRFTMYDPAGTNIVNALMDEQFGWVHFRSGAWLDRTQPLFSTYPAGWPAYFVMIDTDDVVYLGPHKDAANGIGGSNVTIRAGRGTSGTSTTSYKSTLQIDGVNGLFTLNNFRSANTTDTLRVTLPDLSMDGVVVQQPPGTTGMLYLGHPFAYRDLAGSATFFSIDHNGGIDFINSRQYTWPSTTPVVTGGVPMVLGYTTQSVANNPVTLSWMQMTGGSGGAGHVIQDEGGPLPAQGALNFTGAGVTASNNGTFPRTDVTIWTATPTQEGTVSISAQHFGGRKHFDNGLAAYDSVSVPIVAQYTGSTSGAHIQEWWPGGGTAIAYIDTQPVLRLGSPGLFDGFIELCSAVASSQTIKLACGIGATAAQVIFLPKTFPSVGQVMQVQTAGAGNVQMQWGTGGTGSGYSQIQEDGTNLPLRSILNFAGTGFTAADDGSRTTLTLFPASTTQDGIVNNLTQTFTGRKTFNVGATMTGVAAIEPVLTCSLIAGGGTTARVQEWRNSSATALAYIDATPKFTMACDVLPDVDYPTTARHLGNSAFRWAEVGTGQITWNNSNMADFFGSGSPVGLFPGAGIGSLYRNTLGTAGQTIFTKQASGWVALSAGSGSAGTGTNNTLARWSATSGILADAGIVDNVASGPGSAGSGIIFNRDFVYGRADGTINFGDTVTRIGGVYIKNALWMWSGANAGNSPSAPTTMGFLSGGASTYSRILVSGNENYIQGSPQGGRLTIGGYHAIELRGSRRNGSAGSISTTAGDGYGVLVWQEGAVNTIVPLIVGSQLALVGDLTEWQNNGVEKAAIGTGGTLRMGGLQGRVYRLNPGAGTTTNMDTTPDIADCRTIICETASGTFFLLLPTLSAAIDGRSYHIILKSKLSGNGVGLKVQAGTYGINEVAMTTSDVWNLSTAGSTGINQRYVVITADWNAGTQPQWRLAGFYSP